MGKSLSVLMITDEQIQDFVLTRGKGGAALPMGALKQGDVHYVKGLSDPAHAISSATTKALTAELQSLPEPSLRERFDPPKMLEAGVYTGRLWRPPADGSFNELMGYFRRFRDFATEAAKEGKGLVFCRYEDW